jgi:hypothetical protein
VQIALIGARLIALIQTTVLAYVATWALTKGLGEEELHGWLFLPLLGFCVWRSWRLAVIADDHDIAVRNFWRTHRIPWSDVTRIRYADFWPSPLMFTLASVIAIKTQGRRLPVYAQALVGSGESQISGLYEAAQGHPHVWIEPYSYPPSDPEDEDEKGSSDPGAELD